jgi:peroxiredoxin Q/BCP
MLNQSGVDKMPQALGKVKVGDFAPDFSLPDQANKAVHLDELVKANIVVLYFYPKDFSSGCTLEACTFRDNFDDFVNVGATVVGVSSDSPESHQSFIEKHHLPFTLVSDEDGTVQTIYGVKSVFAAQIIPGRITYIIDKQRVVRHIFSSRVDMRGHVTDALKVIKSLQAEV